MYRKSPCLKTTTNCLSAPRIARSLRRDLPVVELGGSIGVVACVTNRLLKDRKAHLVVEANPLAIPHLEGKTGDGIDANLRS